MAEYTIPKPYRDFYVTNPMIELQNNLNTTTENLQTHITDLQNIVMTGYISTDLFEGHCNQVINFSDEKHGFSLTNDASSVSTSWSVNLKDASLWESGSIGSEDGIETTSSTIIRLKNYIPIMAGATYSITATSSNENYRYLISCYDGNHVFISNTTSWASFGTTFSLPETTKYIRLLISNTGGNEETPTSVFTDITALSVSISAYTAPTDVSVKVAEHFVDIPVSIDKWEQGTLNAQTGLPYSGSHYVRTIDYIPVMPKTTYKCLFNIDSSLGQTIYFYTEDNTFINTANYKATTITTPSNCTKIKVIFYSAAAITPATATALMTNIYLVGDLMTIQANDTRVVTMPAFTSLYIESNVPYHGHALDLAE